MVSTWVGVDVGGEDNDMVRSFIYFFETCSCRDTLLKVGMCVGPLINND